MFIIYLATHTNVMIAKGQKVSVRHNTEKTNTKNNAV